MQDASATLGMTFFVTVMSTTLIFRAMLEPDGPSFIPTQTVVVPADVLVALGGKAAKLSSPRFGATRCGWGCCRSKAVAAT